MLQDLAILTGGVVIRKDEEMRLEDVKLNQLGRLRSLKVTATNTTLTPDNPDSKEIKSRNAAIKKQINSEDNQFKKERLQDRLAKLSQGVATIRVGGASESEVEENRERVIEAVYATKAALEDGVVPGGGVALRDIAETITGDEVLVPLIKSVLIAPFEQILQNSDIEIPEKIEVGYGIDVLTDLKIKMIDAGIVDPVKVTQLAIRHAFSVSAMMLTTDCLVTQEPDESVQKIKVVNQNA